MKKKKKKKKRKKKIKNKEDFQHQIMHQIVQMVLLFKEKNLFYYQEIKLNYQLFVEMEKKLLLMID